MDIAIFGGLVVLLVTLRHLAARQVAAGNGRAVWIVFLPVVIAAAALVVIAAQVLLSRPLVGVPLAVVGAVILVTVVRSLADMSRRVSATPPGGDITLALVEPLASLSLVWDTMLALGSLLLVVGTIVWGVTQPGR